MSQYNINSVIEFIGEFFSDLPPHALAIITSIITLAGYIAGGIVIATIFGFLALYFIKNGMTILFLCALITTLFSIYGVIRAFMNYKYIMLSYENNNH